jgi:hypothetical protein
MPDEEILYGIPKVNPNTFNNYVNEYFENAFITFLTNQHIMDIFAGFLSSYYFFRKDGYHTAPHFGCLSDAASTGSTAGRLVAFPFYNCKPCVASKFSICINNEVPGSSAHVGLYSNKNGLFYPGNLLVTKTIDCSTDGLKETEDFDLTLMPNTLYWLAYIFQGTPTSKSINSFWHMFDCPPDETESNCYYSLIGWQPLPDPFPAAIMPGNLGAYVRLCMYLTHYV